MHPGIRCCCAAGSRCSRGRDVELSFEFKRARRSLDITVASVVDSMDPVCPDTDDIIEAATFSCIREHSWEKVHSIEWENKRWNSVATMSRVTVTLPYVGDDSDSDTHTDWIGDPGTGLASSGFSFSFEHPVDVCEANWYGHDTTLDGNTCIDCTSTATSETPCLLRVRYAFRAWYSAAPAPFNICRETAYTNWTWEVTGGHLIVRNASAVVQHDFDLSSYTLESLRAAIEATTELRASTASGAAGMSWPATLIEDRAAVLLVIPSSLYTSAAFVLLWTTARECEVHQHFKCAPYWEFPRCGTSGLTRRRLPEYDGTEAQFCLSFQCRESDYGFMIEGRSSTDGGWKTSTDGQVLWETREVADPEAPPVGPCDAGDWTNFACDEFESVSGSWAPVFGPYGDESHPITGAAQVYDEPPVWSHTQGLNYFTVCPLLDGVMCVEHFLCDSRKVSRYFACQKV